jgi:hypothetical protein
MRRCGTIGCCDAGFCGGAGVAGASAAGGAAATGALGGAAGFAGGITTAAGGWACAGGGVTTTAGGAAGFSGAGGAALGGMDTIGGACRGCGVIMRPSGCGGAAGFAGGGVTTAVFSAGDAAGCALTGGCGLAAGVTGGLTTVVAGRAGGTGGRGGCCCSCSRCLNSFITSPGLEILERSIFGLMSDVGLSLEAEPDLAEKCFLIFSASSSSTELEWVFFSVIPTSSNTSRIALLFTSSSLARSLIRIFIPFCGSSRCFPLRDHIDLTALFCRALLRGSY